MKIFHSILIHLYLYFNWNISYSVTLKNKYCVVNAIKSAINEIKPYQVILLIQEHKNKTVPEDYVKAANLIVEYILSKSGAIIISLSTFEDYETYFLSYKSLIQDPRATSLFISIFFVNFLSENSIDLLQLEFESNIEFFIKLSPSTIRTQHFAIILASDVIPTPKINDVLDYVWTKSFLDTTILQFLLKPKCPVCDSNMILHSYNPFSNISSISCYSLATKIFPNKLRNMFKYPLKMSLLERPPAVNFERDANGYPININGTDYAITQILSEAMNFSVELIAPNISGYGEPIDNNIPSTLLDLIVQGDIDFSGNQIFLHLAMKNYKLYHYSLHGEQGIAAWIEPLVALVPVAPVPMWIAPLRTVFVMLSLFGHVGLIYLLVKSWRFKMRYWRPHCILQVMLGNPTPRPPTKIIERLILFFLFGLAQQYSTRYYAELTDDNFQEMQLGPFHTLNDLAVSNLVLEMHENYVAMTFDDGDEILQRLQKKVRLVEDVMDCPKRLLKKKNIACLIDYSVAWTYVQKSNQCRYPRMKIMKKVFWNAPKGIIFSAASPYVEEFSRYLHYIKEHGLWQRHIISWVVKRDRSLLFAINESQKSQYHLKYKLVMLWLAGCSLSGFVFFIEIVIFWLKKCYNFIKNQLCMS